MRRDSVFYYHNFFAILIVKCDLTGLNKTDLFELTCYYILVVYLVQGLMMH